MVLTSSTTLLLLSLNTAILLCLFLENIWLPCWASLLPEYVLFVQVHAQRVPAPYNCPQHVPSSYNCPEHVPTTCNCREHVPLLITVENTFRLVITVGNTFPLVITVGNTFPLVITVGNTFSSLITVGNTFLFVITFENTFPLLITVWKNNDSSSFLKKRGTSEMSSMVHRRNNMFYVELLKTKICSQK